MTSFDPQRVSLVPPNVRTDCPDCRGGLAVMRVIAGRDESEYWTMRCTHCGGIHLDIVNPRHPASEHDAAPAA